MHDVHRHRDKDSRQIGEYQGVGEGEEQIGEEPRFFKAERSSPSDTVFVGA